MFKKSQLTLAICSILGAGVTNAAVHLVDGTTSDPVDAASKPAQYSSEVSTTSPLGNNAPVAGDPNVVDVWDGALDAKSKFGFSIGAGTTKYVRFELTNATFANGLSASDFVVYDKQNPLYPAVQPHKADGSTGTCVASTDINGDTDTLDIINAAFFIAAQIKTHVSEAADPGVGAAIATTQYVNADLNCDGKIDTYDLTTGVSLSESGISHDYAGSTVAISRGGLRGDNYVILEVSAATNKPDLQQDDFIVFQPANGASGDILVTTKSDVSLEFGLYETAVDAVGKTNRLQQSAAKYITFVTSYTLSCSALTPAKIDVVKKQTFEDEVTATNVFTLSAGLTGTPRNQNGSLVTLADYYAGASLRVTGSFTGLTAYMDSDKSNTKNGAEPNFAAVAGLTGTYSAVAPAIALGSTTSWLDAVPFRVESDADPLTSMVASSYSVELVQAAGTLTIPEASRKIANCGKLMNSGSSDRLDLALTPSSAVAPAGMTGAAYPFYVRVTNPTDTGGKVSFKVWNDAGKSVEFPLSSVPGYATGELAAYASTNLITIDDIYTTGKAADATWEVFGVGAQKLRIEVSGEFGDDAMDGSGYSYATLDQVDSTGAPALTEGTPAITNKPGNVLSTRLYEGIHIQGLAQTKDKNGFYMMTK